MRTSLLLLSFFVFIFSGWSQSQRIGTFNQTELSVSQEMPVLTQQQVIRMSKERVVNGEQEMPSSNTALVNIIERDRSDYIRCSTTEMEAARLAADPTLPSMEEFENWIATRIAEMDAAGHDRRATYEIPYIVHVVHGGESIGTGPNLAASQVNAQIQQLNDDYQRNNSDAPNTPPTFAGVTGSIDILFKPAVVDPVGTPLAEPGINRIDGDAMFGITSWEGSFPTSNTQVTLKPSTQWDPTRYMNIWSCNLGSGLLGYAQFPEAGSLPGVGTGNGSANTDGVVVLYSSMGSLANPGTASPYNYGRTLTHEVGHWLGLKHIWGDGDCSVDDYCGDTPLAGSENYTGSPCTFPGPNTCNEGLGDLSDMFQNFMDYSDDECMNLFTDDQISRIMVVLANDGSGSPRRASLLTSNVGDGGGPTACQDWVNPDPGAPTGVWTDFNSTFGGAPCDPGTGCPFNEITGFEVWASEAYTVDNFVAGGTYSFSMCNGPGAGSWVPEFTIFAPSGAVDAFGAGDGDGCTITWTASESGTYIIAINEAGFCGAGSSNEATDNGFPALTCTESVEVDCPEMVTACNAGNLAADDSVAVCAGETVTMETDGTDTIPTGGDYSWDFIEGVDGTGGLAGGFSIINSSNSFTFDAGINGILAANALDDLEGTWIITGFVRDVDEMTCSSTPTSRAVNFLPNGFPGCDPVEPCSAGTLANSDSMAYCPGEMATIETNGDEQIPTGGGYAWQFVPGVDGTGANGTGFFIPLLPTSYTFDAGVNGILAANALPDMAGTWYVSGFSFTDSNNVSTTVCEFTPTSLIVNFVDAGHPACAPAVCENPTALGVDNITTTTADASWTAGNIASGNWDLELVDITGGGNFMGVPTNMVTATSYQFNGLTPDNDYDVYVRENCPEESDIVITGVFDGPLSGGLPKFIELYTLAPIPDASVYGIGSANNGGGTDGQEWTAPAVSLPADFYIYVASDSASMAEWFETPYTGAVSDAALVNGDDAVELFKNGQVVDVFGEIDVDGTNQPWEYLDGWAYRNDATGPDGSTFVLGNWSFSGKNALDGETTNSTAATPFPVATYSSVVRLASEWVGPVRFTTLVDPCDPDITDPTAVCQDLTVQIDGTGLVSIAAEDLDNGSSDGCGAVSFSADQTTYGCMDLGIVTVTVTVTDGSNNTSTCTSNVTVQDNIAPTATCMDLTVQLDAGGSAAITGAQLDNGSLDNCEIDTYEASVTSFGCNELGTNAVILTVTDNDGNSSTCSSTVTVEDPLMACVDLCDPDETDPTAVCQDLTVQLNAAGTASITASQIDGGSSDGCGAVSLSASQTDFTCSDVGSTVLILTVTDGSNNESTCDASVSIQDNVSPVASCVDFTVQLDAGGSASISGADIDGGSTDACDVVSMDPSVTSFTCSELGANSVTLLVGDTHGNTSTCISSVTVEDPLMACVDPCDGVIGDTLEDPILVLSFPYMDIQNSATCFNDLFGSGTGNDVWYQVITSANADSLLMSTCADTSDFNTILAILDINGVLIASNDNDPFCSFFGGRGGSGLSTLKQNVDPSTTYYVVVDGNGGSGTYELNISEIELVLPPVPSNDTCGGAILIACDDVITGNTGEATSTDAPAFCGTALNTGPGVWYQFAGNGDNVTLSLCGSSYDTKIGVYSGSCGALACVGGNDDDFANCGTTSSQITVPTIPGTDYFIYISGFDDEAGEFTLDVSCETPAPAPPNNTCAGAIEATCGTDMTVNGTGASAIDAPTCGGSTTGAGLWYTFTGDGMDWEFIATPTEDWDAEIQVHTGTCGDLTCEGNADAGVSGESETIIVRSDVGVDYYVYIGTWISTDIEIDTFQLEINCMAPPECQAGVLLDADSVVLCPGEMVTITTDGDSIVPAGGSYGLLFEQGPDGSGALGGDFILFFQNTPFSFDETLDGLLPGNGFPDFAGTWYVYGAVTADVNDAFNAICDVTDDYMVVNFLAAGEGPCAPPPPVPVNDTCAGAIAFSCPDGIATMTVDATSATAVDAPFCDDAGSSVGAGLWYTYEGDGQLLDILAEPYGFDAEIQIWSGDCGALVCETVADNGISVGDPELIEGFVTEAGVTYLIYVGSWISTITEIDSFDLTITCSDPPTCPEPIEITISDITQTSATVSWTPGGDEDTWHVELVDLTAGDMFSGIPTNSGITDTFLDLTGLAVGNDYAVYVIADCGADSSEWAGPEGFTTLFPVPDNDLCEDAIAVACESTTDGTTVGASTASGLDFCGTSHTTSPGVWYSFTGTGGDVTFSTCNAADYDSKIGVFTGDCGSLTCVDGNDDGDDCGLTSEITVPTAAGQDYFIIVSGFGGATGDFTLSVTCAEVPVCENPTALSLDDVTDVTADISWTAGDDETLWDLELVDITGGGSFTGIPTANDLTSPNYTATGLTPGSSYEVWVRADCGDDTSSWVGPLEFTTTIPVPGNDLCEDAIEVTCGSSTLGTTIQATFDDVGTCGTSNTAPGVWYYFAGNGDDVTLSTCNTADYDTKISVFEGTCGSLTCVDGNDDGTGCSGFTSELTFGSESGTDYYILVHGFSGNTGNFELNVTCVTPPPAPDNDLCADAIDVTCGSVTSGTTIDATGDDAPATCGTSVTAPGVWYHFEGTDQDVTFSTCGTADYDTKISVYSGDCGSLTCVDGNDDGSGCSGFTSELEVRTYTGTDYYVYVHGFSSNTGNFDLSVTCADTCEAITVELESITDVSCFAPGGIDINVTTGVGPFTFEWSDGSSAEDLVATEGGEYSVTVTGADGCIAMAGPFEILEEPAPGETAPPVVTSPGCSFDGLGYIDVTIGGGTPPYTFLWSNGANTEDLAGLAAGTYTLTVTDSTGCTYTTQDFVLTETNDLIELAPAVITPVDCYGNSTGAIDITIGGGVAPYTYRWSNDLHTEDVDGLAAGEYVVYVEDATGCTYTSAIIIVPEPDELVVSGGTVTDAACNGEGSGSITGISVTGGTEPYTYLWSDGTTTLDNSTLAAGTHQLTVTDANGCVTLSGIYLIQQPDAITLTSIVVTDAACNGEATGAIDIEVGGGTPPYTYAWDIGQTTEDISGLFAGDYSGTITDALGCIFTGTITVGEAEEIAISAVTVTDASCNGSADGAIDISVTGGTPPYTYLWDSGETTQDIDGLTAGDYSGTITDANGCTFTGTITVGEPDVITTPVADVTDISCNGGSDGSIDIEVDGGTPPYDYSWSNGETTQDISDLGLGVYVLTVTDINGCTLVTPALFVTEPTALDVGSLTVTDIDCNGNENGAIDLNVTGGTPGYTYVWSNGSTDEDLSDLGAGIYTVTVTDGNGCTATSEPVEVEEPFVVFEALPADVTDVSCNGEEDGAIDITLQGGTLAYDIVWSNGANTEDPTDLAPGEYTFTVTDFNGCVYDFGPITVGEPDALLPIDVVITDVACFGASTGAIDVIMSGGTEPYTYLWSNGATTENLTGVPAGDYNGVITDANGCTFTSPLPIPISQPATALEATGESTPASDPGTSDGSVTIDVTGGDAPYDFLWNTGDETQNLDGVGVGTFCAEITDANDCTIEICVEVGLNTAVLDIFQISDLVLYPNPSNDVAYLNMSFTKAVDVNIQLTDVLGRVLETTESLNVIEDEVTFDVSDYSAGTYFIRLTVEGGVVTLPLVVQH